MTLEDFFTLTEIKNGLTVLSRVEELVTVMQKEKDCVVKNAGDATRQWAAVASTLSATENKDCLDLFLQLDGLWFIHRWLQDAQRFNNDTNDSCVEESLSVLLRALEKLSINYEKSISSGIFTTVKNLLGHNSIRVNDRATLLFNSWEEERDSNMVQSVAENVGEPNGDRNTDISFEDGKPSSVNIPLSGEVINLGNQISENALGEALASSNSDTLQSEQVGDLNIQTQLNELGEVTPDHSGEEDRHHLASAVVLNSLLEDGSREENYTGTIEIKPNTETNSSLVPSGADELLDNSKLNEFPKDEIETCPNDRSFDHSGDNLEILSSDDKPEPGVSSSGVDAIRVEESLKEISLQDDSKGDCAGICPTDNSLGSDLMGEMNYDEGNYYSMPSFKIAGKEGECHLKVLQETSTRENVLRKHNNLETMFSSRKDNRAFDEPQHSNKDSEDGSTDSGFSESILNSRRSNVIEERSDMELEYGIADALEVARKVAQEVEREMVGYRGPCSSSSERISGGGIRNLGSPDSITRKHDEETGLQPKDLQNTLSHSTEEYSEEVQLRGVDNSDVEEENVIDESSQVIEARHEAEVNREKGPCNFDLNQEVYSDDIDHLENSISVPISVVSVSRPAAVPGLLLNPWQFEGTLGWKGSAATSAFRRASPRRTSECDKSLSFGGNYDTKERQDILTFDLNVAETGDEVIRQTVVSSDLPPRESLEEASHRRDEGIGLDLNCISDDGDASVLNLRLEARPFHNDNGQNASPASSSSSMRNIDLNDRPFILIDSSEQAPIRSSNVNMYRGSKSGADVISIMGTKVELGRKKISLDPPPYLNGRAVEHASGNITRTGVVLGMNTAMSYPQAPFFGYNGLTVGPTMPFSTAIYGPSGTIPYMVDSRGGSVVPQILGSTSSIQQPSYSQPPFILSLSDSQSGLNGLRPSHPNFDLNSGFMVDGVDRELGGPRQFFLPVHNRNVEDQFQANSLPSSSGIGGKRKEPDGGGWDSYPFSYKHQQPPWK